MRNKKDSKLIWLCVLMCIFSCRVLVDSAQADEKRTALKRVLIITGEDFKGHLWRETTPVLRGHIEKDERLNVDVVDDLTRLGETKLDGYDAVVMHFKNYDPKTPGRDGFDALKTYVHKGGGLVLVHFACGAFQEFKDEFVELGGRVWDPKLPGHDKRGLFEVKIEDDKHPVTRGMKSFKTTDELYTCLVGEMKIRVLASAVSNVDHKTHPMAFVLNVGKGRVFHSPLGHNVEALDNVAVGALYRRATAWAAGLKIIKTKNN